MYDGVFCPSVVSVKSTKRGRWIISYCYQVWSWEKRLVCETALCVNGFLKCFIKDLSECLVPWPSRVPHLRFLMWNYKMLLGRGFAHTFCLNFHILINGPSSASCCEFPLSMGALTKSRALLNQHFPRRPQAAILGVTLFLKSRCARMKTDHF